jgi:hypothetical protein
MQQFKRYYTVSAAIITSIVVLSVIGSLSAGNFWIGYSIAAVSTAAVALIPIFLSGGIIGNPRLSITIAGIMTIVFGGMVGFGFLEFIQTKGGEGPRGEGSPAANMIAIAFFAAVSLCPWLLTTLRGLPHWNNDIKA